VWHRGVVEGEKKGEWDLTHQTNGNIKKKPRHSQKEKKPRQSIKEIVLVRLVRKGRMKARGEKIEW